eukprot:TRINITY_DN39730_c0_g1_i1.p1 TRINITY_DN39730_c0_g1~~TRINITY_DN39730_c0_g1_i1.p1  ORF type:complete len:295 (+),score=28.52 TRINITY_DN39730_c0_g1_i1:56-940(+)
MASAGAQKGTLKARGGDTFAKGEAGANFPILCETCLGPSEFVRMIRSEHDKECMVCKRPMTCFRWKPGRDSRYKTTVLCQTCAKVKNCCQCCIFDLEYGLPVAVRDAYAKGDNVQRHLSDVQREYFAERNEVAIAGGQLTAHQSGASRQAFNPELMKLSHSTHRYERNRPHICSFFVKGECRRGKECPYRHEKPEEGEMAHQNVKDRYYGNNDPVANKIFRLQREREEALEARKKMLEEEEAATSAFNPSTLTPPPGAPPTTGIFDLAPETPEVPQYPSMSKNWMGDRGNVRET